MRKSPFFIGVLIGSLLSCLLVGPFQQAASAKPPTEDLPPPYSNDVLDTLPDPYTADDRSAYGTDGYFRDASEVSAFIGEVAGDMSSTFAPVLMIDGRGTFGLFSTLRAQGDSAEVREEGIFTINQELPLDSFTNRLRAAAANQGLSGNDAALTASWVSVSLITTTGTANMLATVFTKADGTRWMFPNKPLTTYPIKPSVLVPGTFFIIEVIVVLATNAGYGPGDLLIPDPNCGLALPVAPGDPACPSNVMANLRRCLCLVTHSYDVARANCAAQAILGGLVCLTGWNPLGAILCAGSIANSILCFVRADEAYAKGAEACYNKAAVDGVACRRGGGTTTVVP